MNVLIFAAGLGTRFRPETDTIPKALIKVNGKPLLQYAIDHVVSAGARKIVINVHYLAQQIINYVEALSYPNVEFFISDETQELLDTGGGLIKAASYFTNDEPILLYNSDVICNVNLTRFKAFYEASNSDVVLLVNSRNEGSRFLLFDEQKRLCGWQNVITGEKIIAIDKSKFISLGFCGIHLVSSQFISHLGGERNFSITKGYLELASKVKICGFNDWEGYWFDVGSIEKKEAVEHFLCDY